MTRTRPATSTSSRSRSTSATRCSADVEQLRPAGSAGGAEGVQIEDPHVQRRPALQRRPQRPVQAVLEVDLALVVHGVREQITVEGGVVVDQVVELEVPFRGGAFLEPDGPGRYGRPVAGGQSVIRIR